MLTEEGGDFFENYEFYMTHSGLIKLESSNLLDIIFLPYSTVYNISALSPLSRGHWVNKDFSTISHETSNLRPFGGP